MGGEAETRMKQLVARHASADEYHPPTLQPEPAPARCPRCAAPLGGSDATSAWTIAPFLRDTLALLGTGVGGCIAGVYAFNGVMPAAARRLKGRSGLQMLVAMPPVVLLSVAGAGVGAGVLPAFGQLITSTYHMASASSHAAVARVTARVEGHQIEGKREGSSSATS